MTKKKTTGGLINGTDPKELMRIVSRIEKEVAKKVEGDWVLTRKQKRFLGAYLEALTVSEAARVVNQTRQHHYMSRRRNPLYRAVFEEIETESGSMMIDSWLRDAHEAQKLYRFDRNGQPLKHPETGEPYYEKKIDTVSRIFYAKAKLGLNDQPNANYAGGNQSISIQVLMPGGSGPNALVVQAEHKRIENPEVIHIPQQPVSQEVKR